MAGIAYAAWVWAPAPPTQVPLVHVVDGDSLEVRNGEEPQSLRLIGVDAVEYRQTCKRANGALWDCGKEARTALVRLAGKGPLSCDLRGRDHYQRTLATCRTAPAPDGVDLAAEMVRAGWGVANNDDYRYEEVEAREARRGIWQGAFDRPDYWRKVHGHEETPPSGGW